MKALLNAWNGLKRYVQDLRINADFSRREKLLISAYAADAERKFNTTPLELEISGIEREASAAGSLEFGSKIDYKQLALRSLAFTVQSLRSRIEALGRDFRRELDELHEEKARLLNVKSDLTREMRELQGKRAAAKSDLDEAYGDFESAKSEVNGWYDKSDRSAWLLGNSGKKIPKRSLFGQSHGDLYGYKRQRDSARQDIGSSKSDLADVQDEQRANKQLRSENQADLSRVFQRIDSVQQARQSVYELKQQGVRLHLVERELSDLLRQEVLMRDELWQLEDERDAFVVQQRACLGMGERIERVRRLKSEHIQFLALFESESVVAARREAHRQTWLRQR
jgi:predicted  nucleic acid-binding Zn-ribbon protein